MDCIEKLENVLGKENIMLNENMSKHTSFKTGGSADIFVKVNDIDNLKDTLDISKEYNLPIFILGNGSNILVKDKGIRGIVCKINIDKFETVADKEEIFLTVGSGCKNSIVAQKLLNMEIEGFEFASRNSRNNWWSCKNECRSIW